MRYLKYVALLAVLLFVAAGSAQAQVRIGVRVGPVYTSVGAAPVCPYGYYGYYPYACAPYGYYGPSWFVGGVFVGAGPWYHGRAFYSHAYYGRGYYGRGFYGRPGYAYRAAYGYRAPVHGFVSGHAGFHGGYHGGHR
jgi:hypothetical protein